jgi:dienelactone hydrolase
VPRLGALIGGIAVAIACSAVPASAAAPLGLDSCGPSQGVYQCSGLAKTWDGVPLDTTVSLPRKGAHDLPLVVELNGFGNSKYEYLDPASKAYTDNAFDWAKDGYAVLTYTARGQWGSCGTPDARSANPAACADGYIHLADVRYEARDAQTLIGELVDEGVANRRAIGVTGDSYGGGQTLELAALNNRVMLPSGKLVPWRSPDGTPLHVAAAAPVIPWTDLISAAAPNGTTRAYGVTPRNADQSPVGVEKETFVNAIFAAAQFATGPGQPIGEPFVPGRPMGFLSPPGVDPQADVSAWVSRTDQGEPYTDASAKATVRTLKRYHSPYFIDASHRPPPMLISSGFTDDLFPVDEALRYANRTRKLYPALPISLFFGDFGHQRAQNKHAERQHLVAAIHGLFDHYLKHNRPPLRRGVTAYVETCPKSKPSLGPYRARTFAGLARGSLHYASKPAQIVLSDGGNPAIGRAIDPVSGGGDACATTPADPEPGTATYDLPTRKKATTLIGAPTIHANLKISGVAPGVSQLDARLWDVAPDGTQTLVARGAYRPHDGRNKFELHPGAWRFAPAHTPKLELLGNDAPFLRPSNGNFSIDVSRLRLRLPVR